MPGATLTIQDKDGNVVRQWVSGDKPTEIRGLKFDTVYTLVETAAPNGYEVAESIRFKLVQRKDENGDLLNAADVYVCTGKDWLIFDHWEKLEDGMVIMRDAPSPETPPTPDMAPRFADGQIVWAHKAESAENGEIVLCVLNNQGYCKKLHRNEHGVFLFSLNPKYDPIPITEADEFRIMGCVVG